MRLLARVASALSLVLALGACTDSPLPVAPDSNKEFTVVRPEKEQYFIPIPIKPLGPDQFVDITAGLHHTCARKMDNSIYCWGRNDQAQAGNWSSDKCMGGLTCVIRPRLMDEAGQSIDAGHDHTCALGMANEALCWGSSSHGQVGAGVHGYAYGVQEVKGGLTYTSLSGGGYSTCGTTSGGMYCWGQQVGSGAPQPTLVSTYSHVNNVSVGFDHACGILAIGSGEAFCWGNNHQGQLGLSPQVTVGEPFIARSEFGRWALRASTQGDFTCVDQGDQTVECSNDVFHGGVPTKVGGGMALRGVSTNTFHACALTPQGEAFCWGAGKSGQLGNGTMESSAEPQPVADGRTYRAIAAGGAHTCAIGTDNEIYCWGRNNYGELGIQGWSDRLVATTPMRAVPAGR